MKQKPDSPIDVCCHTCHRYPGQWTGEQRVTEALACLGEAVGVFKCLSPREMWSVLPGGVPYYQRVTKVGGK
jgi:hypothetical protein